MTTLAETPVEDRAAPPRRLRRRLALSLVLLLAVGLLGLVLASRLEGPQPARSVLLDRPAPGLAGETLTGQPFDLGQWRGQVVLVNVWASWCVPCKAEQPLLVAAHEQLAPLGLQIVGINVRDRQEQAQEFLREHGNAPWPSVVDPDGRRAVDWGTFALPETYLVATDGTIVAKAVGELDAAWIQDNVVPLLASPPSLP